MKILLIPDLQIKPNVPTEHLKWIGKLITDKRPDVIVQIGDFADMQSLSSYDVGKKCFEGRRYKDDVNCVIDAQWELLGGLIELQSIQRRDKKKVYQPRMVLTLGNHENRIARAVNSDPKLDGVLSVDDLQFQKFGWEVVPFLRTIVIEGVAFSHYYVTGTAGRPASTANAQLNKKHMSCIAGHQQGMQIATAYRADGALITSIIAGSCYLHDEEYMGEQGNRHWRGVIMLNDVHDGEFDVMPLSLKYLEKKYGE